MPHAPMLLCINIVFRGGGSWGICTQQHVFGVLERDHSGAWSEQKGVLGEPHLKHQQTAQRGELLYLLGKRHQLPRNTEAGLDKSGASKSTTARYSQKQKEQPRARPSALKTAGKREVLEQVISLDQTEDHGAVSEPRSA